MIYNPLHLTYHQPPFKRMTEETKENRNEDAIIVSGPICYEPIRVNGLFKDDFTRYPNREIRRNGIKCACRPTIFPNITAFKQHCKRDIHTVFLGNLNINLETQLGHSTRERKEALIQAGRLRVELLRLEVDTGEKIESLNNQVLQYKTKLTETHNKLSETRTKLSEKDKKYRNTKMKNNILKKQVKEDEEKTKILENELERLKNIIAENERMKIKAVEILGFDFKNNEEN